VHDNHVEATPYAASTGLTTPLNPDGTSQSIYGPGHEYLTQEDLETDLGTELADRGELAADVPLWPEVPEVDTDEQELAEQEDSDVEEADAAEYGEAEEAEGAENEVSEWAPGPLPAIAGHQWTPQEQAGAQKMGDIVFDRAVALGIDEEQAAAHQLVRGDYPALRAGMIEQDREAVRSTRAELIEEYGDKAAYRTAINTMAAHLTDPTFFPNGSAELVAHARLPDGNRLINHPDIARYFIKQGSRSGRYVSEETQSYTSMKYELENLMNTDIQAFQQVRQYGPNRDMTGSELLYAINKHLERA